MADRSRDEKLAAAKKRLKKYQQKSDKGRTKKQKNSNALEVNKNDEKQGDNHSTLNGSGSLPEALETIEGNYDFDSNKTKGEVELITAPDSVLDPQLLSVDQTSYITQLESTLTPNDTVDDIECDGRTSSGSPTASTERIMQLSRHLNGIISENDTSGLNSSESSEVAIRDLEARNVELAAILERRNHSNEQLTVQINQLRDYNQRLQTQIASERTNSETTLQRELSQARDQVGAHLQTVGILVAEKSELQSQLSHSQRLAQQRLQEVEDAASRLRATKSRIDELESTISSSRESSSTFEAQRRELRRELDRVRAELQDAQQARDDLAQNRDELQQRLQARSQECLTGEKTANELRKQLELSQIYIEQLSSGRDSVNEEALTRVRQLESEKGQLQQRLEELDAAVNQLTEERDRLASQYREYIQQLQGQGQQLSRQVMDLTAERDALLSQSADFERLLSESRTRVQRLEEERMSDATAASNGEACDLNEREKLLEELRQVTKEKTVLECSLAELRSRDSSLTVQLEELVTSNRRLNALLEERELERLSLANRLEQASEERVNRSQLLEEMQSDKTALSRALAQNREMKNQLMELETSYVQTTQDHMEVTTKWQHEQHVTKELATRLQQQESELKEVRELLAVKEEDLRGLKQSYYTVTQQMFDLESTEERKKAMQAQTHLVENLQKELNSAQDKINSLTSQNSELRTLVHEAQAVMSNEKASASAQRSRQRDDSLSSLPPTPQANDLHQEVSALQASVSQLQMERDQLMTQFQAASNEVETLQLEVDSLRPAVHEGRAVTVERFAELQQAQEQLEEKFNASMEKQASLRDQNEYLEHLVMQLEGETATIGDYISIYQRQRLALQEREHQKARDVRQLERERQMLRAKLAELQNLVLRLLQEKEGSAQLTDYLTQLDGAKKAMENGTDDWPSMSSSFDSDSEDDFLQKDSPLTLNNGDSREPTVHRSSRKSNSSSPGSVRARSSSQPDQTAKKIINLISELGVEHDSAGVPANMLPALNQDIHYFRPCKCCTGKLQLV